MSRSSAIRTPIAPGGPFPLVTAILALVAAMNVTSAAAMLLSL
jgi:hypothetical protein